MTDRVISTADAMLSGVPCLDCGKPGPHKHIGYASSRACVEVGKLCDECHERIRKAKHDRGWYVWPSHMAT